MKNCIVEISKKKARAGRTPVKLILHEIHKTDDEYNGNGINWVKEYCENNIESIQGMPLVAQFLDDEHKIPFGSHGNMVVEDDRVMFENSLVVGGFERGYVAENIEVNGKSIDAVIGEGYVYDQRFPNLVDYLQKAYDDESPVDGSIEICASKSSGNKKIVYDGGYKEKGRKPQIFDYSGHAFVIGEAPADNHALLVEMNVKMEKGNKSMNKIKDGLTIETNKLDLWDLRELIHFAVNKAMGVPDCDYDYEIYKMYVDTSEIVFRKWRDVGVYYSTTYKIEGTNVTLSDIYQVEEDWKPISKKEPVEINSEKIRMSLKEKGGKSKMKNGESNVTATSEATVEGLNKIIGELNIKIGNLEKSIEEKDKKINEVNGLLVTANKNFEAKKLDFEKLEVEVNAFKEKEEKEKEESVKAEFNSYYKNEIPKNGFSEEEMKTLEGFVEKNDLEGLKNAEMVLVFNRHKEARKAVETNSGKKNELYFPTKDEKQVESSDQVEAGKALFN